MAEINLSQAEADSLFAMEKQRVNDERHTFPIGGKSLNIPLESLDKHEKFLLDRSRGRIDLLKVTMQNRGRKVVVLVRLDLGSRPHRNPDGEEISSPHVHIYREGFGDKWAEPVSKQHFSDLSDLGRTLREFMAFCNIVQAPYIERGLFT